MRPVSLTAAYEKLYREATELAGRPGDFAQRAMVYRQIFRDSQGNHAFPLIAAHGALWGAGQFRFGLRLARWLAWQYFWSRPLRSRRLAMLAEFFDALRDINRRVCVDTYVQFHLTRRFCKHPEISKFLPPDFLRPLRLLHEACRRQRPLAEAQRRTLFEVHFLHEQQTIVGDTLDRATAALAWPLAKFIALRPRVRFVYFPAGTSLAFADFSDRRERIENGLKAFDLAAGVGWPWVEQSLAAYGVLDRLLSTAQASSLSATSQRLRSFPTCR